MHRRTLVKAIPAVMAAASLAAPALAQRRRPRTQVKAFDVRPGDALVAQSGVLGSQVFVVGVLRCSDPAAVNRRIQAARLRTRYRCILGPRSRNRYKAAFFDALLDDWQHHDDIHLRLRIVHPPAAPDRVPTGDAWMRGYVDELTKALAMAHGMQAGPVRVLSPQRFQAAQQAEMEKLLLARNTRVRGIEKVWPRECELLQFLNTVTGVVRAAQDKHRPAVSPSPVKSRTIDMLRASLRADLSKPFKNRTLELQVA